MTDEQFTAAQAKLAEVDTERATLGQQVRDAIDKAREWNEITKALQRRITDLDKVTKPLRETVAAEVIERKRVQAEEAKKVAEARAKEEAEAKAKEKTELEKLAAENAELKEQLAKKG